MVDCVGVGRCLYLKKVYSISQSMYRSKCEIVCYDVFTKDTTIVYSGKDFLQWHVSKENLIIGYGLEGGICWNSMKLKDEWWNFHFLHFIDDVYINDRPPMEFYNCKTKKTTDVVRYFVESYDGKKIVFGNKEQICVQDVSKIELNDIFNQNKSKLLPIKKPYHMIKTIQWLPESYCILFDRDTIYDVELDCKVKIKPTKTNDNIFLTPNGIIFSFEYHNIVIYCPESKIIKKVHHKLYFIGYYRKLDILITQDLEYYRIKKQNKNYELHRILFNPNFGLNYLRDRNVLPYQLKMIMDIMITVPELPDEIVCENLYSYVFWNFIVE